MSGEFDPSLFISPDEEKTVSVETLEFIRGEAIAAFDDIASANEATERKISLVLTATAPTLVATIGFFFVVRKNEIIIWEKLAVWLVIFAMLGAVTSALLGLRARRWSLKGGFPTEIFRADWLNPSSLETERKKYLIQSIRSYQLRLLDHEKAHTYALDCYRSAIIFCLLGTILPSVITLLSFR